MRSSSSFRKHTAPAAARDDRWRGVRLALLACGLPVCANAQTVAVSLAIGWVHAPRQVRRVPERPLTMHETGNGPAALATLAAAASGRIQPLVDVWYTALSSTATMDAPSPARFHRNTFSRHSLGLGAGFRLRTEPQRRVGGFISGTLGAARSSISLLTQSAVNGSEEHGASTRFQGTLGAGVAVRWRSCEWQTTMRMAILDDRFGGARQWPLFVGLEC